MNIVKEKVTLDGKPFTFVDLFAGAGGFSEGFLQTEHKNKFFNFVAASDINENCELTHVVRYNHQLGLDAEFLKQAITEPDFLARSIRWGYYIGEKKYQHLGSIVPFYLYNFIFFKLNYKFIIAETLSNNLNMARVLKFHGFKRIKIIKKFILRNGRYLDKYNFNMSKENWIKQKKFHRYNYNFQIQIIFLYVLFKVEFHLVLVMLQPLYIFL